MIAVLITLATFLVMECVAYVAHRYVMHGFLWGLHKSHHLPRERKWEWNDLFAIFFAPIAIVLMGGWLAPEWRWLTFPIGTGMTLYGAVYFFIHDVYTHRRFFGLNWKNRWLMKLRSAHRHHHADVSKLGQEPFGFVWFMSFKPKARPSRPSLQK